MKNDTFLHMYFKDLYPIEEQHKFDLYSPDFYLDARNFYCKKLGELDRKMFIKGIKYLLVKIKLIEDLFDVLKVWDSASSTIFVNEVFIKERPNLITEFRNEVQAILNNRKEYLIEQREKELRRLREEKKNSKIIISSLLRDIKTESEIPFNKNINKPIDITIPTIIEIEKLSIKINFKYRDQFKNIIEELSISSKNPQKVNGKDFTAIASILFYVGWISKDITFMDWLRTFSEIYHRKLPTYKETQVKDRIDYIKAKVPFLDDIKIK